MTVLEVADSELVMRVVGLDRLWAFKSELRVPLAHVAGVQLAADDARLWWHGWRAPGTHVPGIITAGTYYDKEAVSSGTCTIPSGPLRCCCATSAT